MLFLAFLHFPGYRRPLHTINILMCPAAGHIFALELKSTDKSGVTS